MTFFYNLNKKLDEIRATPSKTHGQLNERDLGKHNNATTGFAAVAKKAGKEYGSKAAGERVAGAVLKNIRGKNEGIEDRIGDLDQSNPVNVPAYQRKAKSGDSAAAARGMPAKEGVDKQKFAALAPPKDKITFADKIAGAKKEVDEMLGDVAAEAIKGALSGKQKKLDKNQNGKLDANDFAMLRKGAGKQETDEGWDDMMKDVDRRRSQMKTGEKVKTSKGEVEKTATGIRHTRSYDAKTGETDTGDDSPAPGEKRGRGRPKKAGGPNQERVTAKSRKADRTTWQKKTNEGDNEGDDVKQAMAVLKKAGYKVSKAADGAEELDEKAVSKKQQRFMGMVHATQKGEKAPSKEVAKVAKSMGKKDAEDFASTKHKGLPEKKKPEGKKKEKTEEAGGTGTPTASSGFSFGKGIYDSMNHELENMIKESMARLDESMNVSMNMNSDAQGGPSKSLTVTATDDDALKLGTLLKNAGLGDGSEPGDSVADEIRSAIDGNDEHGEESCASCGGADCGCNDAVDEAYGDNVVSDNQPDWPTDQEGAEDNFEYAGGLNKPKSTGQSTTPVLASQEERQVTYENDDLARMKEMAGIKEGKKPDFPDVDDDNNEKETIEKALKDKAEKKVDESILSATANLWKEYKVQAGV